MTDWQETVFTHREASQFITDNLGGLLSASVSGEAYPARWHRELQAKHTGELADFIIALVISIAQRQEGDRILEEIWEHQQQSIPNAHYVIFLTSEEWQSLRGDKGE